MRDIYDKAANMAQRDDTGRKNKDRAKRGLQRLIKTRCTTIFIGALDSIEQTFGRQWGIDKDPADLTERERNILQLWKDLRKEILDKGNYQTKNLLAELELFEINLKKCYYEVEMEQ